MDFFKFLLLLVPFLDLFGDLFLFLFFVLFVGLLAGVSDDGDLAFRFFQHLLVHFHLAIEVFHFFLDELFFAECIWVWFCWF